MKIHYAWIALMCVWHIYAAEESQHKIDLNDVSIKLLKGHPEYIEDLVRMWYEAAGKNYYTDYDEAKSDYTAILENQMNDQKLPLAFVAIFHQKPIGLCALRDVCVPEKSAVPWNDDHPEIKPWLALSIACAYQKQGIGTMLAKKVLRYAHDNFGFKKAYVIPANSKTQELYTRKGCIKIADTTYEGEPVVIMEVNILNHLKSN